MCRGVRPAKLRAIDQPAHGSEGCIKRANPDWSRDRCGVVQRVRLGRDQRNWVAVTMPARIRPKPPSNTRLEVSQNTPT